MILRSLRVIGLAASAAALAGTFQPLVPPALLAFQVLSNQDDLAVVADYRLRQLPPETFVLEMENALQDRDPELAASLLAVSDDLAHPVRPELRQRITDAQGFNAGRTLSDFWDGVPNGNAATGPGLGGTLAADMTGVGDVRDLWREGSAYLNGEDPDEVVLVLAAAGVAITAGTILSGGAGLPAKTGVTVLKAAKKARTLPKNFVDEFVAMSRTALDRDAVVEAVEAAKRLDIAATGAAAGRLIRPAAMKTITTAADDVASITTGSGYRAVNQTLSIVDSSTDLHKMRRLADATGDRFRGVAKVLGKAAWELGEFALQLMGWVLAALGWLLSALLVVSRTTLSAARGLFSNCCLDRKASQVGLLAPSFYFRLAPYHL